VLTAIGTITIIATIGQGIRDIALIAYPIIFIFAGLTLNRALFRVCVGLTLLAIIWLGAGETLGWFVTRVFEGGNSLWIYPLNVSVLLVVSAIAVEVLTTNMRDNLEKARLEIARRQLVEDSLRKSDERFNQIMAATNDALWDWNLMTGEGYFNPGYYHMLGYEIGDFPMQSSSWDKLIHPDDRERTLQINLDCIDGRCDQFEVEYRLKTKSGDWRWVLGRGKCVARDERGRALRLVGTHMDLSARKQIEDQLRYQSTHDVLTGLYNRTFFEEELARLERSREFPISIIVADVDGLKMTNDTLGHAAGDRLLQEAANLLQSVFRAGDMLARIGGDEFSALLPNTDVFTAEQVVTRIKESLAGHNSAGKIPPVRLSLGVATAERGNLIGTFTLADQRMYADKAERRPGMG